MQIPREYDPDKRKPGPISPVSPRRVGPSFFAMTLIVELEWLMKQ
jgi:hypothetical protein